MDALIIKKILINKVTPLIGVTFFCISCQLTTYVAKNLGGQIDLITSHQKLDDDFLKSSKITADEKRKLELALEAKTFAETELGLAKSSNYTSFKRLDRPYVSYVVSASEAWQLKAHEFSYPIFGKMPYKGFFNEQDAKQEELELKQKGYDTYLRGVPAYSTLGWLNDPILSSMLQYSDIDLVNTIIHETVHTTLYIKNNADFNERLATFLGNKGAESFYLKKEGPESKHLKQIKDSNEDDIQFSLFISREIQSLEIWYKDLAVTNRKSKSKEARLEQIKERFYAELYPKLKVKMHYGFNKYPVSNARLLVFKTYMQDLSLFEKLFNQCKSDYSCFLQTVKKLEKSPDPEKDLVTLIQKYTQEP